MTRPFRGYRAAAFCAALLSLAACGNDPGRDSYYGALTRLGGLLIAPVTGEGEGPPPATSDPAQVQRILAQLPDRLGVVRAEFPKLEQSAFAVESATNNGRRTYQTFDDHSLAFRGGVLTATRGFLFDLMTVEADGAADLVRRRGTGTVERVNWYLDGGSDDEEPLSFTCQIAPEGPERITLVSGQTFSTTRMRETCQRPNFVFNNFYWVTGDGRVVASDQWVSREIGTVRVQHVRD